MWLNKSMVTVISFSNIVLLMNEPIINTLLGCCIRIMSKSKLIYIAPFIQQQLTNVLYNIL